MKNYVLVNGKKLRYGYTTGSCAAAAAKAATTMLLKETLVSEIELMTPKGILLQLQPIDINREQDSVSCAIRKDAGDDSDITNGILIYAKAAKIKEVLPMHERVKLQAGEGIGRVTKPGLDQPVGAYAINSGPRAQIKKAVETVLNAYHYEGNIQITLWIPQGKYLAEKTFNPKLGIEGGISIIGTSGIVEPMSEDALLASIKLEIHVKAMESVPYLILTPGNYGWEFIQETLQLSLEPAIKCSNFIADALEAAWLEGFCDILLIGHIGKLIKLGAGARNTHSRYGDGRMKELAHCIQEAGYQESALAVQECVTTEEALHMLQRLGIFQEVMQIVMRRMSQTLERWKKAQGFEKDKIHVEAITFSKQLGIVGMTKGAQTLLEKIR